MPVVFLMLTLYLLYLLSNDHLGISVSKAYNMCIHIYTCLDDKLDSDKVKASQRSADSKIILLAFKD
jgi:hypothetical protein